MRTPSIPAGLVALLAALAPAGPLASDRAFDGTGASLVPRAEPRVRMVSQDVRLTRAAPQGYRVLGPGHWRIEARYRFRNLTDKTVTLRIGAPEPACLPEMDCAFDGFQDLTTSVRGLPVTQTLGSVDPDHPMAEEAARVHLFTVRFAPGETVAVTHSYRHALSEQINGGEDLTHLTRGGAAWAGSVGVARFRVSLPFRPWGLSLGGWGDSLTRFQERLVDGATRVELLLERTDWRPERDLRLYIGPGEPTLSTSSLIAGCPAPGQLFARVMAAAAFDAAAAAARLGPLSARTLRRCRNAVYAHHGYRFTDAALNRAFYGETGIRVLPPVAGDGRPGAVFARNPDFSPAMITAAEQSYVAAIRALERRPRH